MRGLELTNGRVTGVWTEHGLIKASTVVCAGGAWSSRLLRQHGIELPVANIVGTALRTTAAPEILSGCVNTPDFALRRRLNSAYTVAIHGYGRMELAPQGMRYAVKFYEMYRSKLAKKLRIGQSFLAVLRRLRAGGWIRYSPSRRSVSLIQPLTVNLWLWPSRGLPKNFPHWLASRSRTPGQA